MNNIVDMHCHILPEIDDGAKNEGEAYQMLRMAYDEGIRVIVATPHHHERRGMCTPGQYKRALSKVRKMAKEIDEKFYVMPGMEIYFSQDVLTKLEHKKVQTMGVSDYVLIEFSPNDEFRYIQQALQQVQMKGFHPIVAHIERYDCLHDHVDDVEYLIEMGAYVQVNAGSIVGTSGRTTKRFVKELLERQLVHFVGTDAHSSGSRSPMIKKSADFVEKRFGEEYAREIFRTNGLKVLKNKMV